MRKDKKYRFETLALHAGQEQPDPTTDARAVPIYQTTSYVFENCKQGAGRFELSEGGNIYSRIMNPTTDVFEVRINALEGGVGAVAVASGSAAITYAIMNIARQGDHVVAANTLYGGTYNLLAHTLKDFGIETTFVNPDEEGSFEGAVRENTKLIYIESMGNPNASLIDMEKLSAMAHSKGLPLVVDNTFATPYLLRPIEHGADIVVHSATKFIGGHGTAIGGVVVDGGAFDWKGSGRFPHLVNPDPSYHGISFTEAAGPAAYITRLRTVLLRDTGATLAPMHSFFFLQGLETLPLRIDRHRENTEKVIAFLKNHPKVERVNHPSLPESGYQELYRRYFPKGGGSIFTFEVKGGAQEAMRFADHLELFSLLANVADVKSLVIHPASTTHSQMTEEELQASGIRPSTIRLSIGVENVEDILEDLGQALEYV